MTKTIIAIAVTAAAYLIAGDTRAATTTLDLNEPVAMRSPEGSFMIADAPRHWLADGTSLTFLATIGTVQQAGRFAVSVDCAVPQEMYVSGEQRGARIVPVISARGTLARQMVDHLCASMTFDRPRRAY